MSTSIPTSEGAKHDTGKLRFDLFPVYPVEETAHVYTLGAKKYADRNWEKGLSWGRVFGAMMRHGWAFWRGERYDRECLNPDCREYLPIEAATDRELACHKCGTGGKRQHHLSSVAWCAWALMEYERTHPELDDRPKDEPFSLRYTYAPQHQLATKDIEDLVYGR